MAQNDLPSPSANNFTQRVRETLMVALGRTGDPLDRAITLRDLIDGGLAKVKSGFSLRSGMAGSLPITSNSVSEIDLTPPPSPTGFALSAAISHVFIEHDAPTYLVGHGHLRTHVYGVTHTAGQPLPTFNNAVALGQFSGTVWAMPSNPATTWRLWIKWESVDGVLSVSPAGGTNGVIAGTGLLGGKDLSALIITADKISNGAIDLGGAKVLGLLANANMAVISDPTKIADSLISTTKLAELSITAQKIASGAVSLAKFASGIEPVTIATGTLPTVKSTELISFGGKLYRWSGAAYTSSVPTSDLTGTLADAQIVGLAASKITGQLSNTQIAEIDAAKLTGQIVSTQITDNAITTGKISAGAVSAAQIAANTITAANIAAGSISATEIAAGAITAAKIAAGAVTASTIAAGSITGDKIAASTITASQIAADTITASQIAVGAITAAELAAGAVTAGKISAGSIIAGDGVIGNLAITNALIANLAVGSAQIADAAITNAKIGNLAVGEAAIQNGVITNAKIGNLAVDDAKIASLSAAKINVGFLSADRIEAGSLDAKIATIKEAQIEDLSVSALKIKNQAIGVPMAASFNAVASSSAGSSGTGYLDFTIAVIKNCYLQIYGSGVTGPDSGSVGPPAFSLAYWVQVYRGTTLVDQYNALIGQTTLPSPSFYDYTMRNYFDRLVKIDGVTPGVSSNITIRILFNGTGQAPGIIGAQAIYT